MSQKICSDNKAIFQIKFLQTTLTPLRQTLETYVCDNLLRKRNILIKYHIETFKNKIMPRKIIFL